MKTGTALNRPLRIHHPMLLAAGVFSLGCCASCAGLWWTLPASLLFLLFLLTPLRRTNAKLFLLVPLYCSAFLWFFAFTGESVPPEPLNGRYSMTIYRIESVSSGGSLVSGSCMGEKVFLYIDSSELEGEGTLACGDRIGFRGEFSAVGIERSYDRYLLSKGCRVYGTAEDLRFLDGKGEVPLYVRLTEDFRDFVATKCDEYIGGEEGELLAAMISGDRTELSEETASAFSSLSASHLLCVSGLHIGFVAALAELLTAPLRQRRKLRALVCGSAVLLFCLMIGLPRSAFRACIMYLITLMARVKGRSNDSPNSLGTAILLIMVLNPCAMFDRGFQLAVASVGGIQLIGAPIGEKVREHRFSSKVIMPLALSAAAEITLLPLLVYYYHSISLIAIPVNAVLVILAGVGVPFGLVVLPLWGKAAGAAGAAAFSSARLMLQITEKCSAMEGAAINVPSPGVAVIIAYYAVLVLLLLRPVNIRRRWIFGVAAVTCLTITLMQRFVLPGKFKLTVLDVGHGDSICITTPKHNSIVIDAGACYDFDGEEWSAGRERVAPYLLENGMGSVELLVITHAHNDHMGGVAGLSDEVGVRYLLETPALAEDEDYQLLLDDLLASGTQVLSVGANPVIRIDGVKISFFNALHSYEAADENENSLVVLVEYEDKRFLLMGDAGKATEAELEGLCDVDVLKVGHHGSATGSSRAFLRKVKPEIAAVSVGTAYEALPDSETLKRIAVFCGENIYITRDCGNITFTVSGGSINVETEEIR